MKTSPAPCATTLSLWNKLGYGLGDTAANLVWRTTMVFLPIFYTDVFQLSPAHVGMLLLVCRYFDGITDLLMGFVADRTSTRWGRYRPWILWTALPFGAATILVFSTPNLGYDGKHVYAYLTYSLLILVYTANNIPYAALLGAISSDPRERTKLAAWRFACAYFGAILVQGLVIHLVEHFGGANPRHGYQVTMTILAVISVALFVACFLSTREEAHLESVAFSWRADLGALLRNGPWLVLSSSLLIKVLGTSVRAGVTLFYFKYYVGDLKLAPAFMICGLIVGMVGAASTDRLVAWFGKRRTLIGCLCLAALFSAGLFWIEPQQLVAIFVLGTLTDMLLGPAIALYFAMLADVSDYAEWRFKRRISALVFSAGTLAIKFGAGLAGAIIGFTLAGSGYVADAIQGESALKAINMLMSLLPAALFALAVLVAARYQLTEAYLANMRNQVALPRSSSGV